jgi:hypothetical protein
VVMNFPLPITWDDSGRFRIQNNVTPSLKDMKLTAGQSKMSFYKSGSGQIQVNDGNWTAFTTLADWNGTESVLEMVLTQDMIDWITGAKNDGWSNSAFIIQGNGVTISKITITP